MHSENLVVLALLVAASTSTTSTQAPSQSPLPRPAFEVVSIRRSTAVIGPGFSSGMTERPDGGFTMTNQPVRALFLRAYPMTNIVGLPGWAATELYDVRATAALSRATADDRTAMLRAMLVDRLKLAAHIEKHEQPVFDLVLDRRDGKLGPGIEPVETDCVQIAADRIAAPPQTPTPRPDLKAPPPPCTMRTLDARIRDADGDHLGRLGDLLEGEGTMDTLAQALIIGASRPVVNKTGLAGSYRVTMNYDMRSGRLGPVPAAADQTAPIPGGVPSVFTAVQQQLGLKLESSRRLTDALVIDHLERPTEN
jgi:uncharacterized protein (TIGR03435 family)